VTEFFFNYGLFLAKTVTIVLAIAAVVLFIVVMAGRKQSEEKDNIEVKKLNKKYADMAMAMNVNMLHKEGLKKYLKDEKEKLKGIVKELKGGTQKKRVYVVNLLESGGGVVHGYGLGASQLMRVREKNIPLTVSVDKVAASGGYMMACVGNRIMAAPFAIIGSIGVIAQVPNFNKVLKKHDIEYDQFTAGEFKRTVTMFGENTDEAKAKFREEIEDIHALFKDFIVQHRPDVDIVKVSTGESWPGTRALEKNLVDELKTSDDYLLESSKDADIYEVKYVSKKSLSERIGFHMQRLVDKFQYG
jgi:serine protease SohB